MIELCVGEAPVKFIGDILCSTGAALDSYLNIFALLTESRSIAAVRFAE